MEIISKNKRGRGRPVKHDESEYEVFGSLAAKTRRGKQNYIYGARALSLLSLYQDKHNSQIFGYLTTCPSRIMILAELGRFDFGQAEGRKLMLSVANKICESRMKASKAVGFARRWRGKGQSSNLQLWRTISRAIDTYCERYQPVSPKDIGLVLRSLASLYPE